MLAGLATHKYARSRNREAIMKTDVFMKVPTNECQTRGRTIRELVAYGTRLDVAARPALRPTDWDLLRDNKVSRHSLVQGTRAYIGGTF